MERLIRVAEAFERRGIHTRLFERASEVVPALLETIPAEATVAFGGSVTLRDLGAFEALTGRGQTVLWHWKVAPEDAARLRRHAMNADVYLSSSNAVIEDGRLLNIDGTGNRVAAMMFGPPRVIVIAGRNKLAPDYDSAHHRVKTIACPKNAERLNRATPCRKTGECEDCRSRDRMCHFTVLIDGRPDVAELEVWLVNEDLGY